MTGKSVLKQRRAVLRNYLEARDQVKDQLYRLLRLAADAEISSDDITVIADAIKVVARDIPWSIERELKEIEEGLAKS